MRDQWFIPDRTLSTDTIGVVLVLCSNGRINFVREAFLKKSILESTRYQKLPTKIDAE